ncbi:hypothetical protein PPYR_05182 [Photinus pyralis]|uniref:DUF7869 domain-containing protein n=1 Tax=Photinus pyralis TaxID=7054 RepID=A0A5N4B0A5_PHOPY|nr:hypothetical protein PPYR_05182 [Photinus pyralis]
MSRGKYILELLNTQKQPPATLQEGLNLNKQNDKSENLSSTSSNFCVLEKNVEVGDYGFQPSRSNMDDYLTDEDATSGSEYFPDGESSDDSDNEVLTNIREKLLSQRNNDPMRYSKTPEDAALIDHVTADSEMGNTEVAEDRVFEVKRQTVKKKLFELKEKTSRRRLRNPDQWKRRKAAMAGAKGEEYLSQTGKVVPQKEINSGLLDAMCSLYQFSRKKIELIQRMLKNGQNAPTPDKRGRHANRPHKISERVIDRIENHIKKFPAEESHYSRNKNCYKKYLSPLLNITLMHKLYLEECKRDGLEECFHIKLSSYSNIFSTKFNLSFGYPRSDTCSVCDAGKNTDIHTENYKAAFASQKRDREKPMTENNICYLTMDLQQTMPLPKLSTSKAFYLRQMWYYNFGIHCIIDHESKPFFFNWTEDIANRGSIEIASCLYRFSQLPKETYNQIDHLIIWSDSCAGQNKNFNIVSLYQLLILNGSFKVIDHKFPEVGHNYLDSDRNFGRIEKKLRKVENIYVPEQYRDIIQSASTKNCVCVNMENYFRNIEELPAQLHIWNKKTNLLGEKVNFRDSIKWIRVDEFGSYKYKESFDDFTPFHKVDLLKKGHRVVSGNTVTVRHITEKRGGLTTEKLNNLREQLQFVKEEYKWFYENILEQNQDNPKKKRKTT